MAKYKNFQLWLHGLIASFVSGAAGAIAVMAIDPADFNFGDGLANLGKAAFATGLIGLAAYLKEHPVPPVGSDEGGGA